MLKAEHIKLIYSRPEHRSNEFQARVDVDAIQQGFFPSKDPSQLLFIGMSAISGDLFCELVNEIKPSLVFDLRISPVFSFSGLNRALVFDCFQRNRCVYFDIPPLLKATSNLSASLNPAIISVFLTKIIEDSETDFTGPFMFLFDSTRNMEKYENILSRNLSPRPTKGWEVVRV